MTNRLTYFKIQGYPGDITKNCSLNGIEIDTNFLSLEGRDVKTVIADGDRLVITFYNGDSVSCNIDSLVSDIGVGEGIDTQKFSSEKIIATNAGLIKTTQALNVTGENIGSYKPGDVIPANTPVEDILKNLLVKIFDPETVLPKSILSVKSGGAPLKDVYEVGSVLGSCTLSLSWVDGRFVGNESWSYPEPSDAQCNPIRTAFFKTNSTFIQNSNGVSPITYNIPDSLGEGDLSFSSKTYYGNSQRQAKRSDGTNSNVHIDSGETEMSYVHYKSQYKYYYGYIPCSYNAVYEDIIPNANTLRNMNLNTGYCMINGLTTIPEMQSVSGKTSLVLVLPSKYSNIVRTENSMGSPVDINSKWKEQTHNGGSKRITDYQVGNVTTTYYVYILNSFEPILYKNIIFGIE